MSWVLGLDTSNYTTSAALFDGETMRQEKKLLPVKPGGLGLKQSDAVFHHTQQLPELMERLFDGLDVRPEAVAVSVRPREVDGSYMPSGRNQKIQHHLKNLLQINCSYYLFR